MAETCATCDGNGWTVNPDMDINDPNSPDHITCAACGGDGWTQ